MEFYRQTRLHPVLATYSKVSHISNIGILLCNTLKELTVVINKKRSFIAQWQLHPYELFKEKVKHNHDSHTRERNYLDYQRQIEINGRKTREKNLQK